MPSTIFLSGAFLPPSEAKISAFDAGLQHAVGLFETMLAVGPRVVRLERHISRLVASARELGLSDSLRAKPLADAVRAVAERHHADNSDAAAEPGAPEPAPGPARARIRLTITGGDLNLLASSGQGPADPTVLIVAQPATRYPAEMFERGVAVTIADARVNPLDPFSSHKTLNYWPRLRALQLAGAKGAAETIFLQVTNHLAGGAVSNLFLVKDGALLTPVARSEEDKGALPSPVLPGITRATIIEDLAPGANIGCSKRMLAVDDLLDADEVFLTNASWGILPVVKVEKEAIADAVPGPVTRALRAAWLAALDASED